MAIIFNPLLRYTDANGDIIANGRLYFTDPDTSAAKAVYTDRTEAVELSNPVTLDSEGMVGGNGVWLGVGLYDVQVQEYAGLDGFGDPTYAALYDIEGVQGAPDAAAAVAGVWVETVADLRALESGVYEYAILSGHSSGGDGGGGAFRWVAGSSAADNNGTIIVPTDSPALGRWVRDIGEAVNVRWFGGLPGVASCNTAFAAAQSYATTLGQGVVIPGGVYTLTGDIVFSVPVEYQGDSSLTGVGVTVTHNGSVTAGLWRIARGSLTLATPGLTEAPAEWWGVSAASTAAANNAALALANAGASALSITAGGNYQLSNATITKPLRAGVGVTLANTGTVQLDAGYEGGTGSLSGGTWIIGGVDAVRLSWFEDGAFSTTILARAHLACVTYGLPLLWDGINSRNVPAYTQANDTPNIIGSSVATIGTVSLYRISAVGAGAITINAGGIVALGGGYVLPSWFASEKYLRAVNCAIASGLPLLGAGSWQSASSIDVTGDITIVGGTLTSTSTNGLTIGAGATLTLDGVTIDATTYAISNTEATGRVIATGCSFLKPVQCKGGRSLFSSCRMVGGGSDLSNLSANGCSIEASGSGVFLGGVAGAVSVSGGTIDASALTIQCDASTTQVAMTGVAMRSTQIIILTTHASTTVRGLHLSNLVWDYAPTSPWTAIITTATGGGSFASSGHEYRSVGHTAADADIVLPMTERSYKSVMAVSNGSTFISEGFTKTDLLQFGDADGWYPRYDAWSDVVGTVYRVAYCNVGYAAGGEFGVTAYFVTAAGSDGSITIGYSVRRN